MLGTLGRQCGFQRVLLLRNIIRGFDTASFVLYLCPSSPGMVNVRHPRCANPACKRQPSFGLAGGEGKGKGMGQAVFCMEHRKPGMVGVKNNYRKRLKRKADSDPQAD